MKNGQLKDGQYGASDGFTEYELLLDESKFRLTPQPIDLVTSTTGKETDLVYRILPYEVYQKTPNYDHKPFPEKYVDTSYVKNAGYVNPYRCSWYCYSIIVTLLILLLAILEEMIIYG